MIGSSTIAPEEKCPPTLKLIDLCSEYLEGEVTATGLEMVECSFKN